MGLPHTDFTQNDIHVTISSDDNGVVWNEGTMRYFPIGARIGVAGSFDEEGIFRSWTAQIFGVGDDGTINDYEGLGCIQGTLEGVSVDEVIERAHAATQGLPMTYAEHSPFASHCFNHEYAENAP